MATIPHTRLTGHRTGKTSVDAALADGQKLAGVVAKKYQGG